VLSPLLLGLIFIPLLIKKAFPNFFEVKFDWDKALIKKLVKFGIPVMIGWAGWYIISYTDTLLLTFFTKMDQVGLYNAALPTSNVLQYFSIAMAAVLLPMTSEMWARNHKEQLAAGVSLLYKYSFLMIIPISLAMFSFPEVVLNILFGAKYVAAANALRVLVIGTIFYVIAGTNFSVLSGIGKPKISSKIILIAAGINIILNLALIPFWGIIGSAIASATGFLVMLILSVIYLERNVSVSIPVWAWIKIAFLGLIFIGIIAYLKRILVMNPLLEAIVVCLVAGLVYIVLAFVLRIVSIKELKGIINILRSAGSYKEIEI
jgi:O-antigen/teichoic acid export membrane protein